MEVGRNIVRKLKITRSLKSADELAATLQPSAPNGIIHLHCLELHGNDINIEGAHALKVLLSESTALTCLKIQWSRIPPEALQVIGEGMMENSSVRELSLSGVGFDDEQASLFACMLEKTLLLQRLDFSNNDLKDRSLDAMGHALTTCLSLTSLDLSWNCLELKDAVVFLRGLSSNSTLRSLKLGKNDIAKEGARTLAECLMHNTSLQQLDLSSNKIGNEGAEMMGQLLRKTTSMQDLNLFNVFCNEDGPVPIARAMATNTTLLHLDLGCNRLSAAGIEAVASSLTNNSSLQTLSLTSALSRTAAYASPRTQALIYAMPLRYLDLSYNELQDSDAYYLARALGHHGSLQVHTVHLSKMQCCSCTAHACKGLHIITHP
jgi:Ran GTPase-activating protein (RanGAP) involved in mRNA processing and transport